MRYPILSVFAAAVLIGGCTGDFAEINTNPNGPEDVPPPSILSNALQNVVGGVGGTGSLNITGAGLWVQHFAEIQYRDEDKYLMRPGTSGGWGFYTSSLANFQQIIDKGVKSTTPNWEAVGRIMKSYTFSVMTDAMGDLPYSEALKGGTTLAPKYDTQASIYNALFADLTTASGQINTAPGAIGFASGDILYGGDMTLWRRFGNSLRLRLALHLSNMNPAKGTTEAQAAVAAGVFQSNADNAQLMYLATAPNRNPIYENKLSRDDYGMSKTYVDSLLSWGDPRLPVFAQLNGDAVPVYRGLPNGLNNGEGDPLSRISRIGAFWRETPDAPISLMTYAEVLFLRAEAAQRGWIAGSAATFYNAAITASMEQYGVAPADIATYLAQPRVVYSAGTGLTQISYQKWVSFFMQGMEAWTEFRRTGVPTLVPGIRALLPKIPDRLPYSDNELVLNKVNVDAAVASQKLGATTNLAAPLWFTGRQ